MTTSTSGGSATIYQFPLRGRFAASDAHRQADAAKPTPAVMAFGSWYHEEAVEAERQRKN